MSYRAPDQALEGPIYDTLEGIKGFLEVAQERIKSGDWTKEHFNELRGLCKRMTDLQFDLAILNNETW